jgi:hypothetical protein
MTISRQWKLKSKDTHWACKNCLVRACCEAPCYYGVIPFKECQIFCKHNFTRCAYYGTKVYPSDGCDKIKLYNRIKNS